MRATGAAGSSCQNRQRPTGKQRPARFMTSGNSPSKATGRQHSPPSKDSTNPNPISDCARRWRRAGRARASRYSVVLAVFGDVAVGYVPLGHETPATEQWKPLSGYVTGEQWISQRA